MIIKYNAISPDTKPILSAKCAEPLVAKSSQTKQYIDHVDGEYSNYSLLDCTPFAFMS